MTMRIDRVRHGRQMRLPEIGEVGQQRLCDSDVVLVSEGEARAVEAAYLARAGVRVVDDVSAAAKAKQQAQAQGELQAHADALASLGLRDSAPRELADGALRALLALRKILAIDGARGPG